jgi:uncharacterized membrane protein YphA (DoxX/SURF4 family)
VTATKSALPLADRRDLDYFWWLARTYTSQCSGLIVQKNSLGLTVILSLIALRVGIGMHFFREGLNKLRDPKPFSAGFFGSAKGPLADFYHGLVWDRDGQARLDRDAALQAWDQYRAQVEQHFGFDDQQKKLAASIQKRAEQQLNDHFEINAGEIDEYRKDVQRRDRYLGDRQRMETPSLREQVEKIDSDLRGKRAKLLTPIDQMWQGYERELNLLASGGHFRQGGLKLDKPGRRFFDTEAIDKFIPWFDATLGVLLIVGLATRPAALVAAVFLFSVLASQWPTAAGTTATWPQFIEALGLLVVAATGAGRYAGIDGICCTGCCRRGGSTAQGSAQGSASRPAPG